MVGRVPTVLSGKALQRPLRGRFGTDDGAAFSRLTFVSRPQHSLELNFQEETMYRFMRSLRLMAVCVMFAVPAVVPASSGAAQSQTGLGQVALSLEKAIPALVSSRDYRSASNTAFLLATARYRLDENGAACAALSQSLEYYRMAITKETGERM